MLLSSVLTSISISISLVPIFIQLSIASPELTTALDESRLRTGFQNKVLLIRHGEKPKHGKEGLNKKGKKRAHCLRKVLGASSPHNIGLIIAQSYNPKTGTRKRPYDTVLPLATDLGLPVVTDCERDDPDCVVRLVAQFALHSRKDILICWKHSFLHVLAQAFGSKARLEYPDDRFDIMWIVKNRKIISKKSEQCRGLDSKRRKDPDLDIEDEDLGLGKVEIMAHQAGDMADSDMDQDGNLYASGRLSEDLRQLSFADDFDQ